MVDISVNHDKLCPECQGGSPVIIDASSGDLVCTGCGLVLDEHCFDAGAEWRDFKQETVGSGQDTHGRARGDARGLRAMDESPGGAGGTDVYGRGAAAQGLQRAMRAVEGEARRLAVSQAEANTGDAQARLSSQKRERRIKSYTGKARQVISRMALGENVAQRCIAFLQTLGERSQLRPPGDLAWCCALVHLASREEGAAQPIGSLAQTNAGRTLAVAALSGGSAGPPGARSGVKKDATGMLEKSSKASVERLEASIENNVKELAKLLGLAKQRAYAEDSDHMKRILQQLDLAPQVAAPAMQIVQQVYRHATVIGRQINKVPQNAIIASAIFIMAWLLDVERKPKFQTVAAMARATEANVKMAYKLIHPKIRYVIPKDQEFELQGGVDGLPLPVQC